MAKRQRKIPAGWVWAALGILGLQVIVLIWQRQAAAPLGGFLQDPARALLGVMLTGLLLYALIRPAAVVTAALAVMAMLRARRARWTRRTLLRLGVLWVIALGALAASAVTFFVGVTREELFREMGDLWADFWTQEPCVYEGPLEDFSATDTWEIHALDASTSAPEERGGPVLYHDLLSNRQEAPYSFLCPNALVEPLAIMTTDCSLYRWHVEYLPRTGVVTALSPCPAETEEADEWTYGSCAYPKTHGTVTPPGGTPVEILGYDRLSRDQQRLLDLLASGRLSQFLRFDGGVWATLLLDDSLTWAEVDEVLDLYAPLAVAAGGGKSGFWLWQVEGTDRLLNVEQLGGPGGEEQAAQIATFCQVADALAAEAYQAGEGLAEDEAVVAWLYRAAELVAAQTEYRADVGTGEAYSALVEGLAKCDGYSWAYLAVTYRMGIPCSVVEGPNHAWNAVWLGGELRHIDVTWLDQGETISGPWFLMTTQQRQETMEITSDLDSVTQALLLEGADAS